MPGVLAVVATVIVQLLLAGIAPTLRRSPKSPAVSAPPRLSSRVPPQVFEIVNGLATVIAPGDTGKVSVKPALVRSTALVLVNTIVSVDVPVGAIAAGAKDLAIVGRASTVTLALAGSPLLPAEVLSAPEAIALVTPPGVEEVTLTVTVQLLFAGIVPPLMPMVLPPFGALIVVPQVVLGAGGLAMVMPAGSTSKAGEALIVAAAAFGLLRVIVSTLVPPATKALGAKALATPGWPTESVAVAGTLFAPPLVLVTPPAGMVLVYRPPVAERTLTVTVQLPSAEIVPPESATLAPPAAAVTVPPQVVAAPGVGALTSNAG